MRVRGRNHDRFLRHAGRRLDPPAEVVDKTLGETNEIVREKKRPAGTALEIEHRTFQRIVDSGAKTRHIRIAVEEKAAGRGDIHHRRSSH